MNGVIITLCKSSRLRAFPTDVSLYEPIGSDKEGNELSLLDVMESHDEDITESMELQENTINLYHFISIPKCFRCVW